MDAAATEVVDRQPLFCADYELSAPDLPDVDGSALSLLVRIHGDPLGDLVVDGYTAAQGAPAVTSMATAKFAEVLAGHLTLDGLGSVPLEQALATAVKCARSLRPTPPLPTATAAVATLGTHPLLPACIEALLNQDYAGGYDVLVVDNDPTSGAAKAVVDAIGDPRVRYLAQPIKGVSNARNAAALAATTDLMLFTDDDALVDPTWVRSIIAVFTESPQVSAVNGLVMAGSLTTRAEQWFEQACGFNKGYQRFVWSLAPVGDPIYALGPKGDSGPLFPFSAGHFGSGNCMAIRRQCLLDIGGFDPALTTGEDLDVFCRTVLAGGVLVYEPRVIVRHFHRETYDALVSQMRGYGVGLSAFLFKQVLHTKGAAMRLLKVAPDGAQMYFKARRSAGQEHTAKADTHVPDDYPKELSRTEFLGFARGPWHYLRARHDLKASLRQARETGSDDVPVLLGITT
ncbi:MAG: glycosyltransferase family 2 protein [Candidatus Nanopelagicales bacterium]